MDAYEVGVRGSLSIPADTKEDAQEIAGRIIGDLQGALKESLEKDGNDALLAYVGQGDTTKKRAICKRVAERLVSQQELGV